jgi:hypothetical protein
MSFTAWFTDRSPAVKVVLLVGAIAGAMTGVASAWSQFELPMFATRGYVAVQIGPLKLAFDNTGKAVRDLQIEAAEGKLAQTKDALAKWKLEGLKTSDPTSKELIHKQQRELEATQERLEDQLKSLRSIRSNM